MGFILNPRPESQSFDIQLERLAQLLTSYKGRVYIWAEKIIEMRALQMDGLIDEHDDIINSKIDSLEAYIEKCKMLLHYLSEQIICARQSYKTLYEQNTKEFDLLLKNYHSIIDTLSKTLLSI